jgi:hypothetical protein
MSSDVKEIIKQKVEDRYGSQSKSSSVRSMFEIIDQLEDSQIDENYIYEAIEKTNSIKGREGFYMLRSVFNLFQLNVNKDVIDFFINLENTDKYYLYFDIISDNKKITIEQLQILSSIKSDSYFRDTVVSSHDNNSESRHFQLIAKGFKKGLTVPQAKMIVDNINTAMSRDQEEFKFSYDCVDVLLDAFSALNISYAKQLEKNNWSQNRDRDWFYHNAEERRNNKKRKLTMKEADLLANLHTIEYTNYDGTFTSYQKGRSAIQMNAIYKKILEGAPIEEIKTYNNGRYRPETMFAIMKELQELKKTNIDLYNDQINDFKKVSEMIDRYQENMFVDIEDIMIVDFFVKNNISSTTYEILHSMGEYSEAKKIVKETQEIPTLFANMASTAEISQLTDEELNDINTNIFKFNKINLKSNRSFGYFVFFIYKKEKCSNIIEKLKTDTNYTQYLISKINKTKEQQ